MILILKLLSIVVVMVIFLRLKVNLAITILTLAAQTILLFQVNIETALVSWGQVLIADKTLKLLVIVSMVIYVASVQKSKHMFDRLISSLHSMVGDSRLVAMMGPAIVGFLPMPGGALMSAPLVEISFKDAPLKPEFKTFINYWFRHIWEFVWPVYSSLVLFQTLSGIPMKTVILYQAPFTVFSIVIGLVISFLYFKKHGIGKGVPTEKTRFSRTLKDLFEGVWPILMVILFFFILSVPLYLSLFLVAVILTVVKRMPFHEIAGTLFSKSIGKILLLIGAVMIFQESIKISNAFATLDTSGLSLEMIVLVCFLVSFSMGLLTGLNIAWVGISYPILLPLLKALPEQQFMLMSLYVYVVGFAGILLSPMHLCLIFTNEYFKSTLYRVYRYLAPPGILLAILATVLALMSERVV